MVISIAIRATNFAYNGRNCCPRLTKLTASGSASAAIGIASGEKRACALAAVGEHDFAKPADLKQVVGDLEAENTRNKLYTV